MNGAWVFAAHVSSLEDAVVALQECGIAHVVIGYSEYWGGDYARDEQASFRVFRNTDLGDGDIVVSGVAAGAFAALTRREAVARLLASDSQGRFTQVGGDAIAPS